MPREVSKDSCAKSVENAASKTTAKGSGGGVFRPVTFRGGEKEIYSGRGKKK